MAGEFDSRLTKRANQVLARAGIGASAEELFIGVMQDPKLSRRSSKLGFDLNGIQSFVSGFIPEPADIEQIITDAYNFALEQGRRKAEPGHLLWCLINNYVAVRDMFLHRPGPIKRLERLAQMEFNSQQRGKLQKAS